MHTQIWQERRKMWRDDLVSGEYDQELDRLARVREGKASFCGMGLACNRYHEETGNGEWVGENSAWLMDLRTENLSFVESGTNSILFPPPTVIAWYGFHELEERFKEFMRDYDLDLPGNWDGYNYILMFFFICNDGLKMSFAEIGEVLGWLENMGDHVEELLDVFNMMYKENSEG